MVRPIRFDVITLFAEMFSAIRSVGITARAAERGLWQLHCWNPREHATDAYRSIDDRPYGGGPGMVMMAEPLAATIRSIREDRARAGDDAAPVICLSPQGAPATDVRVRALAASPGAILLCGRYEGIDQRLLEREVDEQISVGDFVVSGGELPAMMLIDAAVRLLPGALNHGDSAAQDSFADGLLDCPHYTRPEVFEGLATPEVLLSGHHARIARWRRDEALRITRRVRPDLIEAARRAGRLDARDEAVLAAQVLSSVQAPQPPTGPGAPGNGR